MKVMGGVEGDFSANKGVEARGLLSTGTLKGLQMKDDNVGNEVFKDSVEVT